MWTWIILLVCLSVDFFIRKRMFSKILSRSDEFGRTVAEQSNILWKRHVEKAMQGIGLHGAIEIGDANLQDNFGIHGEYIKNVKGFVLGKMHITPDNYVDNIAKIYASQPLTKKQVVVDADSIRDYYIVEIHVPDINNYIFDDRMFFDNVVPGDRVSVSMAGGNVVNVVYKQRGYNVEDISE